MSASEIKASVVPTAKDYAEAFYGLEGPIQQLLRHVRVTDYLASILTDRLDKAKDGESELADLVYGQVADLKEEIGSLDQAFLDKFNDLACRESAALEEQGGAA